MLGYDFSVELQRARSGCLRSVLQPSVSIASSPHTPVTGGPEPHGVVCVIECMGGGSSLLGCLLMMSVLASEFVAICPMRKVARCLSSW